LFLCPSLFIYTTQGVNVRQRAGALVSLVQDSKQLAEERDKVCRV
jgi:hypothetical protein